MLVELAKMRKEEREDKTSFGVYLWEKKQRKGKNQNVIMLQR